MSAWDQVIYLYLHDWRYQVLLGTLFIGVLGKWIAVAMYFFYPYPGIGIAVCIIFLHWIRHFFGLAKVRAKIFTVT